MMLLNLDPVLTGQLLMALDEVTRTYANVLFRKGVTPVMTV
jgi:L-fucose mutarotase/ribose pyranase (RbsD/FucU family)